MTLSVERDEAELRQGLERWLGRPFGVMTRPASGWSCETLVIDDEIVVRIPPVGEGIFPAYDLEQQAAVQERLASSCVPMASPVRYVPDCSFLGAPFLVMPYVRGPIPAEFTPSDPWLASLSNDAARRGVWDAFLGTVVRIHVAGIEGLRLRTGLAAEIEFWESYARWATDGSPPTGLVDGLAWCRANAPSPEPPPGLLWGDVRLGNVVFDAGARIPKAVLDWDMASAGPVEMDLGWFLALDQLQRDVTGMAVTGFGRSQEAIALVQQLLGRDLSDMSWYEIFALVRAGAISTRIAILFERHGRTSMFKVGEDPALAAALARISRC